APSKTRTERWPSPATSKRVASGRRDSKTNGGVEMPPGPDCMLPVLSLVCVFCQASDPPRAVAWRSRICCRVSSAPAVPSATGSAAPAALAPLAAESAMTAARNHAPSEYLLGIGQSGGIGIGESGVIQRRVHSNALDRHLLGFLDTLHRRFLQMRNHQALILL